MLRLAKQLFSKERDLRMAWQVEKSGRRSVLLGAAHFFPYHFRGTLWRRLSRANTVLLEGPLDEQAMRKVVASGRGTGGGALYAALGTEARRRIQERLGIPLAPLDVGQLLREQAFGRPDEWLASELRNLKPWLVFFGIWTRYRSCNGWTYSLDLDAACIAHDLGKKIRYLESVEEQIDALESIPVERIAAFLAHEDWETYCERYVQCFLAGDLEGLTAIAKAFPTACEAVIERRDPALAERMVPALEEGDSLALVGVTHCPGVIAALRRRGFAVSPASED